MNRWGFARLVLGIAVIGAVVMTLPDMKRYLRIRNM
jgi:hypothetical protein